MNDEELLIMTTEKIKRTLEVTGMPFNQFIKNFGMVTKLHELNAVCIWAMVSASLERLPEEERLRLTASLIISTVNGIDGIRAMYKLPPLGLNGLFFNFDIKGQG